MPKQTFLERLTDFLAKYDMHVATWSPGDGATRYRFYTGPEQDYFAVTSLTLIHTALGRHEAEEVMQAIGAAYRAGYRQGYSDKATGRNGLPWYAPCQTENEEVAS